MKMVPQVTLYLYHSPNPVLGRRNIYVCIERQDDRVLADLRSDDF